MKINDTLIKGFEQCASCGDERRGCVIVDDEFVCAECREPADDDDDSDDADSDVSTCSECGNPKLELTLVTVDTVDGNVSMCPECAEDFDDE